MIQRTSVLLAASLALCGALAAQPNPILLSGPTYDGNGGPLLSGQVYHVVGGPGACGVSVPAGQVLTIQAGAIVKIDGCFYVPGRIVARGTPQVGITFTSVHDDTAGGDTNGNGGATVPQPGDWDGFDFFGDPGCVFEHCTFSYGGRTGGRTFDLRHADVTFRHCRFERSAGDVLRAADQATVRDCMFQDIAGLPARDLAVRTIDQWTDNQAQRCAGGDYALITDGRFFLGNLVMDHRFSMNGSGVFVFEMFNSTSPSIPAGTHWTLPAGTVFKFARGGVYSAGGRLLCQGTAARPVTMTSLEDDTVAGDTNKDGNATQPQSGDWLGIDLQLGDTSVLQHTVLRYGGDPNAQQVQLSGSSARIEDCVIERSAGHGIRLRNIGSPPARIAGCRIDDNAGSPVRDLHWATLARCSNNTASGNGAGDHFTVLPERPGTAIEISPDAFPGDVLEVTGRTIVNSGGSLRIPAGTILKFGSRIGSGFSLNSGAALFLDGTARRPVVLTSLADDSWGGDTNGDGNATSPAPNDIGYIWIGSGASGGVLQNVLYRYGSNVSIEAQSPNVALRNVRVDFAAGVGMKLIAVQGDVLNAVAYGCTGNGIELNNGGFDVLHATVAGNGGSGFKRTGGWTGRIVNSISRSNAVNFDAVPAAQVAFSNGGFPGQNGNIDVDPRFVAPASGDLHVQASSPCRGVADLATAVAVAVDHDENPRVLDDALSGVALPDMGAFERAVYTLQAAGEPVLGTSMTFSVQGPAGVSLVILGLQIGPPAFLPPFGLWLTGAPSSVLGNVPVGQPVSLTVPNDPGLPGVPFSVQGLGLRPGSPLVGHFTAVDRNVIR